MSVFSELKRRNVFRVAAAYLVAGWLLIEVSATLEETLHLPAWADTLLAYFLILGFPVVLGGTDDTLDRLRKFVLG